MFPSVQRIRPVHAVLALAVVALMAGLGRPQSDEQPEQQKVGTRSVAGTPIVGAVVAINNVADYDWKKVSGGGGSCDSSPVTVGVDQFAANSLGLLCLDTLTVSGPLVTPRAALTGWHADTVKMEDPFRTVTVWAMMANGKAAEVYGYGNCFLTRYVFPKLVVGASEFTESLAVMPGYLLTGGRKITHRAGVEVVASRGVQERALPSATGQPVSFRIDIPGLADSNQRLRSIEIGDTEWPVVEPGRQGRPVFGDITIRCRPQAGRYELRDWWIEIAKGNEIRKDVTIQLLDGKGEVCRTYNFISCWPRSWSPGDYDPDNTTDPVLETLVLNVNRVEMN